MVVVGVPHTRNNLSLKIIDLQLQFLAFSFFFSSSPSLRDYLNYFICIYTHIHIYCSNRVLGAKKQKKNENINVLQTWW